jgi:hypothetical protein
MRNRWVSFRLTDEERRVIVESAKAAGMAVGPHMRALAFSALFGRESVGQIRALSDQVADLRNAFDVLADHVAAESKNGAFAAVTEMFEERQKPMLAAIGEDLQKAIQRAPK